MFIFIDLQIIPMGGDNLITSGNNIFLVLLISSILALGLYGVVEVRAQSWPQLGHPPSQLDLSPITIDQANSRVGIGVANPDQSFVVGGNVKTTGSLLAMNGNYITHLPWANMGNYLGPGYVKLVTPIVDNEGNMFVITINGYEYGQQGQTFEVRCGGYAYSASTLIKTWCRSEGTNLPVEIGVENRGGTDLVVIRLGTPTWTSWYYTHMTAEYVGWKAKDPSGFTWVKGETVPAQTGNTNNVVIRDNTGDSYFNAGNVGIGTSSPAGPLQVKTHGFIIDSLNAITDPDPAYSYIYTTDGNPGGLRPSEARHLVLQTRSTAPRDIIFVTGTTPAERMTIYDTGNIGIGSSSVYGDSRVSIYGTNGNNDAALTMAKEDGTNNPVFSILPWDSQVYLSSGVYYSNGGWVHDSDSNDNLMFRLDPGVGTAWYASNTGTASWNLASSVTLWDPSAHWKSTIQSTRSGNSYITGGKVGIGTTNPGQILEVNDPSTHTELTIDSTAANLVSNLNFYNNNVNKWIFSSRGSYSTGPSDRMAIYNSNAASEVMTLLQSGNVGIGTTSPSTRLHVNPEISDDASRAYDGNALMVVHQTPTSNVALNDPEEVLYLGRQGTSGQAYGAMATFKLSRFENVGTDSRSRLDIDLTHGSFTDVNVMTLLSSGNVGIGTTNPQDKMVIRSSTNVNLGLDNGIDVAGAFVLNAYDDARTANIPLEFRATKYVFDIASGGNVGIGVANPSEKLEVAGNIVASGSVCASGGASCIPNLVNIECSYTFSPHAGGWQEHVWALADCGSPPKLPSGYAHCMKAISGTDWTYATNAAGAQERLVYCNTDRLRILQNPPNNNAMGRCDYLCWD